MEIVNKTLLICVLRKLLKGKTIKKIYIIVMMKVVDKKRK